jgi:hypothetical protein
MFQDKGGSVEAADAHGSQPQINQSAGPVRFLIFCSISIFLLASQVAGRKPSGLLVQISRECTPPYLFTGLSNPQSNQCWPGTLFDILLNKYFLAG